MNKLAIDSNSLLNPNWPDARWDVSGAFANDRELLVFHDFFLESFGLKLFSLVHGSPLFNWNSGRVLPKLMRTSDEVLLCLKAYKKRNIAIDLTFSNLYLKEEHMKSQTGNELLKWADINNPTGRNAAIMSSDVLYEHIRRNYPKIKTVSSILKVTNEKGKGNLDYYHRLAEKYDKVMLHPDDALNFKLLEQLEAPDKYEIIVNENCVRNCPIRHKHYDSLSNMSLDFLGHEDTFDSLRLKNGCSNIHALLSSGPGCISQLSIPELKNIYTMGFRNFKIQGRGLLNSGSQILDMARLMLRADAEDEYFMTDLHGRFLEYLSTRTHIA